MQNLPLDSTLPAGHVRVRVDACGVCGRDLLDASGAFPFIRYPTVLGHEMCGVVDAVGASVTTVAPGDVVVNLHWAPCLRCDPCAAGVTTVCQERAKSFVGLTIDGGFATHCTLPASAWVRVPAAERWDPADACTVACTFGTAHHAAVTRAGVVAGEHVVVTGASGGVGSAAVRLLAALGCHVTAVTSSADKAAALRALGAEEIVVADHGGAFSLKALPARRRAADCVLECVGGPCVPSSLRALRPRGRLALVGNITNAMAQVPLGLCILNELAVLGADSISAEELQEVFRTLDSSAIRPLVARQATLEEVGDCFDALRRRSITGRCVVRPNGVPAVKG